jgi:Flp pilus assembly protein TadG
MISRDQRGQVLAFFAVLLPVVLLPLAAYAVDTAFVSEKAAALQAATAQAAEAAAQQADIGALRARSELIIDSQLARAVAAESFGTAAPGAFLQSVVVSGAIVTVTAIELVHLPFTLLPTTAIKLEARASARLVAGYDKPSSRLPLPTSTF